MAEVLVGRDIERALIGGFLDRARTDGEALLLCGEPGFGKTVLLDAAAVAAAEAGTCVLRAGGVEFETSLAFSGLHQLLLPLFGEFGQLSVTHREALHATLGYGAGPPPDRLLVYAATLTVLRQAAAASPVLVIVDDLPWLDRASAGVLGFAARRLAGSRVGFLAASRPGEGFFERAGLPQHELGPLDEEAASALLSSRFPALAPGVRRRVVAEAQGNPLALLELPATLSGAQRAATEALPALLPLSRRLQGLFASRTADLPAQARWLLLLAVLDGTGDLRVLQAAAGQCEIEDLAPAEQAGLVHVDDRAGRLVFRHPLTRSAIIELSTSGDRRRAHRALAEQRADQPEHRAWHLAEAAAGPDEQVALLLEDAADRILHRGDAVGAVAALLRAAELSPVGPGRSRRYAKAARLGAMVTAELGDVPGLLAKAQRDDPELSTSLYPAITTAFLLLSEGGHIRTAHQLLVSAIEAQADPGDAGNAGLIEALLALLLLCSFAGRTDLWETLHAAIGRLKPHPPADLYLVSRTDADPARLTAAELQQIDTAVVGIRAETDVWAILMASSTALYTDRLAACREPLWRVIRAGREGGGAVTPAITALFHLFVDDWVTGRWDEAQQLADEAAGLCAATGYPLQTWLTWHGQAMLAAARGDGDKAQQLASQITRWAEPRGFSTAEAAAHHIGSLVALSQGDFEDAYQHATAISPPGVFALNARLALWVPLDLVEAAIRTRRHAEAAAHVKAIRETGVAAISPRLALLAAGSVAIAAPGESALRLFSEALAIPGADSFPFDFARVQLCYGERLRRARAVTESRTQLSAALAIFERLGARSWESRAASELRATGQPRGRGTERDDDPLTPQERRIAMLAAAGLSNKEIGERLFLSHRTVGAYLYQIFPKLGVRSRAALRDALASVPPEPPGENS